MSHYTKIQTKIVDCDALLKALAERGFAAVENHAEPVSLFGYEGDLRPEVANVVIRRRFISAVSNDIGFLRKADGSFEAIISDYDLEILGQDWLRRLCQSYAYHAVVARLVENDGFEVEKKEVNPKTKQIHLVLRRRS